MVCIEGGRGVKYTYQGVYIPIWKFQKWVVMKPKYKLSSDRTSSFRMLSYDI